MKKNTLHIVDIAYSLLFFSRVNSAAALLLAAVILFSAAPARCGGLEELDKLKRAELKMKTIKEKRFEQGEALQYSRSKPTGPLEFYDPRETVKMIKITDGCVKKLKKFPDADMVKTVCDYMLRARAAAVGIEMIYDTPSVNDSGLRALLSRTTRVVLASEVTLDPNSYFKNWGDAAREFGLKLPHDALNEAARKKGFVNFDVSGGFAELRCRTFLVKKGELILSMPLALMFLKENAEEFDIVKSAAEDTDGYSKYEIRFGQLTAPEAFIPQCAYTFEYDTFGDIYEKASRFIASPDPAALPKSYEGRIILIGDATRNAKTYILKLKQIHNADIIANCIVEIYNANAVRAFNKTNGAQNR
ncbi:MAG TPA: hypothetical protein DC017_15855 [Candidatus Wallbacteria bacterium]|nr:hypothetical protein [Candidatus Wallbacteria bacterium]